MTQTMSKTANRPNFLVLAIQWLLGLAVVGSLIHAVYLSIVTGAIATDAFSTVGTALVTFALTLIPNLIIRFKILPMPAILHTIYVVFVYLAMFCGEMLHFFDSVWWWDVMLHFASGIIFALVGYMVFLALNKDPELRAKMHPASIVLFAVIFAMACGVVWEIFEFGADCFFGANMQRWQNSIPAGEWAAMQNVTNLSNPGLVDTMKDFIMDTGDALLSIPLILRMVKKNSRYVKSDVTYEELMEETRPAGLKRPVNPAPALAAMGLEQGSADKQPALDAA